MVITPPQNDLGAMTTDRLSALLASPAPVVVLLPVGSVEPHGPHLGLVTDTVISHAACVRAIADIEASGAAVLVAPAVPYGVTECARGFKGAVSVGAGALSAFLRAIVEGFLRDGFAHVCLVNNHLEPDHYRAVRAAIASLPQARATVACPLERRWGRTLDDEYKSGACHAGSYETSIMMSAAPELVDESKRRTLVDVPVSLSQRLQDGIDEFVEMGMKEAYAGNPSQASAEHGAAMIDRLAAMVIGEVTEALENGKPKDAEV